MTNRKTSFLLATTSAMALTLLVGGGLGPQSALAQSCSGDNGVQAPDGGWDGTDSADVITCGSGKPDGGDVHALNGDDKITATDATLDVINAGSGRDKISVTGGTTNEILGGSGEDVIAISGGTVGSIEGENGNDTIRLQDEAEVLLDVEGGEGEDFIDLRSSTVGGDALGGNGADTIRLSGGNVDGNIDGEGGRDDLIIFGGHVGGDVLGGFGDDDIVMHGGLVDSDIEGGQGRDRITFTNGEVLGNISGGADGDEINIVGGKIGGSVLGGTDSDVITGSGGTLGGGIDGGSGSDEIIVHDGTIGSSVVGGSGEDEIVVFQGSIGGGISAGADNDAVALAGGSVGGSVLGGAGDDVVIIANDFDFDDLGNGRGVLAGDQNNGSDIGTDTLGFIEWEGEVNADRLREWNTVVVTDQSRLRLTGGVLRASSSGTPVDVFVTQASALEIDNTVTIRGNLSSDGLVDLSATVDTNDRLEITGDFAGDGELRMDAVLGSSQRISSDRVVVDGSTSGTTAVTVTNRGGQGGLTGDGPNDGALLIQVNGQSDGQFVLSDELLVGIFEYDLVQADGRSWFLQSDFLDQAFIYESLPGALQSIGTAAIGTLAERVGVGAGTAGRGDGSILAGVWARGVGLSLESSGDLSSTTGGSFDQTIGFAQAGADFEVWRGNAGRLLAGVVGHAGTSSLDVSDADGDARGSANADMYGGGVTATWYGSNGLYVDGAFQYTAYDVDMSTATRWQSVETSGSGMAVSGEAGWRFALSDRFAMVPQAQLTWQSVELDDFTDPDGLAVSLEDGDSLVGRLGAAVEAGFDVGSAPVTLYGEANVLQEFMGDNQVIATDDTGSTPVEQSLSGTSASFGMGGSVGITEGLSLYAEVDYRVPLDGGVQGVQASGGLRLSW